MSDWYGTHSTVPAAIAGLDLEMPGPAQWFGVAPRRRRARGRGRREASLDDKVRRMLRPARAHRRARHSRLRARAVDRRSRRPRGRAPGRHARASCCCSNRDAMLPLAPAPAGDARPLLAVIGPNAAVAMIQGGGSARVSPFPPVTPLAGLRERFGDAFRVEHERGCASYKQTPVLDTTVLDGPLPRRLLPGPRAQRVSPRSSSRAIAAGSRSPVRSRPRCPTSSRCASPGTLVAPETRRVDVRARADRAGPA